MNRWPHQKKPELNRQLWTWPTVVHGRPNRIILQHGGVRNALTIRRQSFEYSSTCSDGRGKLLQPSSVVTVSLGAEAPEGCSNLHTFYQKYYLLLLCHICSIFNWRSRTRAHTNTHTQHKYAHIYRRKHTYTHTNIPALYMYAVQCLKLGWGRGYVLEFHSKVSPATAGWLSQSINCTCW